MGRWKGVSFISIGFRRRAARCDKVHIEPVYDYYCDREYKLKLYKTAKIKPNNLLIVGEMKPQKRSLPGFWFRWDERANALDVDILGVPDSIKDLFKKGEGGYGGHHTNKVISDKRIYEADIRIPQTHVFHGFLGFHPFREVKINTNMGLV